MKVIIYMRVSTTDQTTESQREDMRRVAAARGWEVVEEIEDVITGGSTARPGLDRLMAMVRRRAIDAVIAFKMDRLGRSLPHLAQIIAEFEANGVALIFPGQGVDTSNQNPAGRMQMHMLMVFADFERSMIRERTMAGLAAAKARGKFPGRPEVPKPEGWREKCLELRTVRAIAAAFGIGKGTAGAWRKEALEAVASE